MVSGHRTERNISICESGKQKLLRLRKKMTINHRNSSIRNTLLPNVKDRVEKSVSRKPLK